MTRQPDDLDTVLAELDAVAARAGAEYGPSSGTVRFIEATRRDVERQRQQLAREPEASSPAPDDAA